MSDGTIGHSREVREERKGARGEERLRKREGRDSTETDEERKGLQKRSIGGT